MLIDNQTRYELVKLHTHFVITGCYLAEACSQQALNLWSLYHNYKGFFSQVLLAVCDAKYKLIFIDAGQYESTNDSAVFRNYELGRRLELYSLNKPSEDIGDQNHFKDSFQRAMHFAVFHGRW